MCLRGRWDWHSHADVESWDDRCSACRRDGDDGLYHGRRRVRPRGCHVAPQRRLFYVSPALDRNRDGLVMGEGGAVLVLETESHAKARGAHILAELAGYGATADAFHVTAPHENGDGGSAAMRMALASAQASVDDLGHINAHGTGTPLNDQSETRAIKAAFGQKAYEIPVSSTKSMTGHMMGATGALEAIFC